MVANLQDETKRQTLLFTQTRAHKVVNLVVDHRSRCLKMKIIMRNGRNVHSVTLTRG